MAAENATKVVELMEVEAVLGKVRCTIFVHVVRGKVATVCYVAGSSFAFVSAGRWRARLCHLEGGAFDWPDGRVTRPFHLPFHRRVAQRRTAPNAHACCLSLSPTYQPYHARPHLPLNFRPARAASRPRCFLVSSSW